MCWCLSTTSSRYLETRENKIKIYFLYIKIERFLLRKAFVEQSDGVRLPYGMSSSLCLTHLEQVRNAKITDDHILIPVSVLVLKYAKLNFIT